MFHPCFTPLMSKWGMNIKQWSKGLLEHPLFKILVVGFLLWVVYKTRFVLVTLFISYILAVSLLPIKNFLIKRKFPEILSSIIPYILLLSILVLVISFVVPTIVSQFTLLVQNFPNYLNDAVKFVGSDFVNEYIQNYASPILNNLGANVIPLTREIVKITTYIAVGFALSFYILFSHDKLKNWIAKNLHDSDKTLVVIDQIEEGLGSWVRGQLGVAFIVGLMTWIALLIVGIDFALTLAIITGIFEFIPYLGPLIAVVPAVAVGFSYSSSVALTILLVYGLIQLMENNLIVPGVMKYSVKLSPILVILLILVGGEIFGVIGAILAVPVGAIVKIISSNFKSSPT